MNRTFIHGRLTKDVETRMSQSGKSISRFTVAEDDGFGDNKHTNFHPCVAFGKTGENIAKYFGKGDSIVIVGRIKRDSYQKDGGDKVYTADVIVDTFDFVGNKSSNNTQEVAENGAEQPEQLSGFQAVTDDDIPF